MPVLRAVPRAVPLLSGGLYCHTFQVYCFELDAVLHSCSALGRTMQLHCCETIEWRLSVKESVCCTAVLLTVACIAELDTAAKKS